jgi:hypothetical protein
MADQARRRALARAVEAALNEMNSAGRYRPARRDERDFEPDAEERPHPLEYDRNGFPAPQRVASFGVRVRRLIRGA